MIWTVLSTLAVGAIGAAIAMFLGVPAPFLTGPSLLVSLVALGGMRTHIPVRLREGIFLVIGTNMGAAVTPEAVATAAKWPGSLVALVICIFIILVGGAEVMRRFASMDRMSALLTAAPGHLSFVLSLSTDLKADTARITLIQSMRVLFLTLLVPFLVPLITDHSLPDITSDVADMPVVIIAALLVGGLVVGLIFQRLRVPAPILLGGMAVSSLTHATGFIEGNVPQWLSMPAFTAMGTLIGTRFSGLTFRIVYQAFGASVLLTLFATLVSIIGAVIVATTLNLPMVNVLIAFAPGGLETMMAMSLLLDANPAYVAAHHVGRLLILTVMLPIVVTHVRRKMGR